MWLVNSMATVVMRGSVINRLNYIDNPYLLRCNRYIGYCFVIYMAHVAVMDFHLVLPYVIVESWVSMVCLATCFLLLNHGIYGVH